MDTLPVFLCSLAHRLWACAVGAGCIYATGRFQRLHYDAEHDDYYAGGNLHDHYGRGSHNDNHHYYDDHRGKHNLHNDYNQSHNHYHSHYYNDTNNCFFNDCCSNCPSHNY